tara:strand:+ start:9295 stop:10473 length:1179 start_codon:yes stop_codon:yes gene_type:complete
MEIIAKIKRQKFINDFFSIYISYFLFIFLSLLFQIFSTKYFHYENSKILIFLFAVYAWGSFLGEAGFGRYDVGIKKEKYNIVFSIYLRKFFAYVVLLLVGNFFLENILFILSYKAIFFLLILFFFSSFFIPANIYKKGFAHVSYLSNIFFVILIFFGFYLNNYYGYKLDSCIIYISIILSLLNLILFIILNKKINIDFKKIQIFNFQEKRINILNYISYLACGVGILIFFLISNFTDNNFYLLFARLIDGANSFFGIMALVCIKRKLLFNFKNIISLTIFLISTIILILFFLILISENSLKLISIFPIFTYYLISSSSLFFGAAITQLKLEKKFLYLIKFNILMIAICLLSNIMFKYNYFLKENISVVFYLLSIISIFPLIYYTKLVKKFTK